MTTRQRPASITVLAVLQGLLGTLCLLGVFALTVAGFRLPEVVPHVRFFPVKLFVVVIVLFVLAGIEFVLTCGLWKGLRWAWKLSLALAVVGIVFFVFSLFLRRGFGEVASLIIDLLVLYYLIQPRVQAYFRQDVAPLP